MNYIDKKIFRFDEEKIRDGSTISRLIFSNNSTSIFLFKNGIDTSISPEGYDYEKLYLNIKGIVEIDVNNKKTLLNPYQIIKTSKHSLVGTNSISDNIYLEINIGGNEKMNKVLKDNEVFNLADLVDYDKCSIVNTDLINNNELKAVLMSFDKGTGLSEHRAPGDALVTILEGTALVGYEGKEYTLKKGDSIAFKKNGRHYLTAIENFKMMLIVEKH